MDIHERILECTKELIQKHGFRRFTMDDIVIELCISKGTIYKEFSSKAELVDSFLKNMFEKEIDQLNFINLSDDAIMIKIEKLSFIHTGLRLKPDNVAELKRYFPESYCRLCDFFESRKKIFISMLKVAVQTGKIKKDFDLHFIYYIFDKLLDSIHTDDVFVEMELSSHEIFIQVRNLLFFGIIDNDSEN
ncbi:MAG: TetR/AcrR family transcriptional regulator [Spirochaetales bacterium]|nr:TetR/AcrR family transcriptional regulator [Spirochaetales bacterium]